MKKLLISLLPKSKTIANIIKKTRKSLLIDRNNKYSIRLKTIKVFDFYRNSSLYLIKNPLSLYDIVRVDS